MAEVEGVRGPALTGRCFHETAGRSGAILVAVGMTLHALVELVLGPEGIRGE